MADIRTLSDFRHSLSVRFSSLNVQNVQNLNDLFRFQTQTFGSRTLTVVLFLKKLAKLFILSG